MKYLISNAPKLLMVALILIFSLSCSKETDLLADYADLNGNPEFNGFVVDDAFVARLDRDIVLDVLSNDMFTDSDNVRIVEISGARNGSVIINEDNSLTYVPASKVEEPATIPSESVEVELTEETISVEETPEEETIPETPEEPAEEELAPERPEETVAVEETPNEEAIPETPEEVIEEEVSPEIPEEETTAEDDSETIDDSFTYTTETENEDGTVTQETGTVTVTDTDEEEEQEATSQGDVDKNYGELKAFPTAKGFGKSATGGRGGYVVRVTNLNDRGSGSLREALKMTGTRTIVFTVGGTINCSTYLDIPYKSGNVTIAGQTAPGDGIMIKGGELRVSASNVIIRYLKIRPGNGTSGSNEDGINISAYNGTHLENIVIDHCSISWARDENLALVGGFSGGTIKKVTIQNSIIAECNYGALNYKGTSNITYYGNLFAHNAERNIRANNPISNRLDFEMINNLVYGASWFTNPSMGTKFSVVNNKYKSSREVSVRAGALVNGESDGTGNAGNTHAYIKGNISPSGRSERSSNLGSYVKSSAFASSGISPIPARDLESRLLPNVGASYPTRDAVDKRLVSQYNAGNGRLATSGSYPSVKKGSRNSDYDSDKDGMADVWERSMGLNPNDKSDAAKDRNGDGYTNLEDFLNDEVDF